MEITITTVTGLVLHYTSKNICIKNGYLYTGKTPESATHSFGLDTVTCVEDSLGTAKSVYDEKLLTMKNKRKEK